MDVKDRYQHLSCSAVAQNLQNSLLDSSTSAEEENIFYSTLTID
jgi:hypothetical protein